MRRQTASRLHSQRSSPISSSSRPFPSGAGRCASKYCRCSMRRRQRGPPLIVSSVRDILQENRKAGRERKRRSRLINDIFDLVLVHGDPGFARLEETFPRGARDHRAHRLYRAGRRRARPARRRALRCRGLGRRRHRSGRRLIDCALERRERLAIGALVHHHGPQFRRSETSLDRPACEARTLPARFPRRFSPVPAVGLAGGLQYGVRHLARRLPQRPRALRGGRRNRADASAPRGSRRLDLRGRCRSRADAGQPRCGDHALRRPARAHGLDLDGRAASARDSASACRRSDARRSA